MKSILYAGATLMIGASIYGFVDYRQSRGQSEFQNMYHDEAMVESGAVEELTPAKKITAASVLKPFLTSRNEKTNLNTAPVSEDKKSVAVIKKKKVSRKKISRRVKFNSEMFSRAPLRREVKIDAPLKTAIGVITKEE